MRYFILVALLIQLIQVGCATAPAAPKAAATASPLKIQPPASPKDLPSYSTLSLRTDKLYLTKSCAKYDYKNQPKTEWNYVANVCTQQGQWDKVEEIGSHMAQNLPQEPWGIYYLSLAAEGKKDYHRALWMADLSIKKAPQVGILHYQKGRALWDLQRYEEGFLSMQEAVRFDKNLIDAHLFLGQVYFRDLDLKKAMPHLMAVISVEPKNPIALIGLSEAYFQMKDYKSGAEMLSRAVLYYPDNIRFRLKLAEVYETSEVDMDESLSHYKKVQKLMKNTQEKIQLSYNLDDKVKKLEEQMAQMNRPKKNDKVTQREPAEKKR